MTKYKVFMQALEKLCVEHKIKLSPSYMDALQVWDLNDSESPLYFPDVEDKTKALNE